LVRIGHRGAAGYAIENTLLSVQKAIDLQVDFIEIDVQVTRDGQLVLFHDKLLDRLTNLSGYLSGYSYSQLRRARLPDGQTIPRLQEVFPLLIGAKSALLIEIISFGIEDELIRTLSLNLSDKQFAIASFSHQSLLATRHLNEAVVTVALIEGIPINLEDVISDCRCDFVGFGFDSITEEAVSRSHHLGASVMAWTVDDPREIARARGIGVDGIISNFPDRV